MELTYTPTAFGGIGVQIDELQGKCGRRIVILGFERRLECGVCYGRIQQRISWRRPGWSWSSSWRKRRIERRRYEDVEMTARTADVGSGDGGGRRTSTTSRNVVSDMQAESVKGDDEEKEEAEEKQDREITSSSPAQLVQELRQVFASGKTRTAKWREEQLTGLARMMREREDEIYEALRQDLNKPFLEGFISEIAGVHDAALEAAKMVSKWMKPTKAPSGMLAFPSSAKIVSEPLGVALIISTWNFPILLSLLPALGALAAGNAVVIKPSELAPATSALLAKLVPLYVDPTAVKVVEGGIPETTAMLEQEWDKIFYTGSTRVGKIIMAAAAKHLTPVTLELGGKSPVIVDSTANLEVTAKRIAWGKWATNNGQACIAPDYLLVEESVVPELVTNLKKSITQFYGDDPSPSADIARIINKNQFSRVTGLLNHRKTAEKVIFGGKRNEDALFLSPTIVLDPPTDSPVMQEEIFGPILPIITVKSVDEAVRFVSQRPKPLALYLFSTDKDVVERVLQETSSGGVAVNETVLQVGLQSLPFGGVGASGFGSYHGIYSFDTFSHKKSVLSRGLWGESDIRYPPYTPKKVAVMKAILHGDFFGLIRVLFGFT